MRTQASRAGWERGAGRGVLRERFARTVTQSNHPKAAKTQNKQKTEERGEREHKERQKVPAKPTQAAQHSTPQGGGLLLLPLLPLPQRSSPWDACTNRRATLRWVRPVVQRSHMLRQSAVGDAVVNVALAGDQLKVNSIICARHAPLSPSLFLCL